MPYWERVMPVEMSSGSTLSGLKLPIPFVAVGSAKSSNHGYCYWAPSALYTVPEGGKFQITVGAAQWNPRLADETRKRRPRRGRIKNALFTNTSK